ncbi:hypothetical protein Gpo141_00000164 [Globisporangium polare]
MRKNSGDRGFSAAVQHRRASGDFEHARAEKLHANLRHGRGPTKLSKRQQQCTVYDTKMGKGGEMGSMSAMSFVSVLVTLTGSLFLISYAVVSTAIANANSQ